MTTENSLFWKLRYANLIALDMNKFTVNMLYLTYQGNELSNRCEALYAMIDKLEWKDEYLEKLMQKMKKSQILMSF